MAKYLVNINNFIFQLLAIIIWEKLPQHDSVWVLLSSFLNFRYRYCFRVFSSSYILGIHTLLRKSIKTNLMEIYWVDTNKITCQLLAIIIWEKAPQHYSVRVLLSSFFAAKAGDCFSVFLSSYILGIHTLLGKNIKQILWQNTGLILTISFANFLQSLFYNRCLTGVLRGIFQSDF